MRTIYSICNISHMLLCCIKKFKKLIGILEFNHFAPARQTTGRKGVPDTNPKSFILVHGIKFFSKYLDAART